MTAPYFQDDATTLYHGDAATVLASLPDQSVDCIVTSPPYFALRDYGVDGQIGAETSPAEFVAALVAVFREARRVLADDGTLWLNLGDSYANDGKWGGSSGGKHVTALHGDTGIGRGKRATGLAPKNLIGIPWRVQCAKCAVIVTAENRPGALYGVVRDLHFHHRLPAPWDERRLCSDCRLSFGCDCWDCASARRSA